MSNLGLFKLPELHEWNTFAISSPSSSEHLDLCLELFQLLRPVLHVSVHMLAPAHANDPSFDRTRRELATHFLAAHLRVLHIIDTLKVLTCSNCDGPAHARGEGCFGYPPSPPLIPQPPVESAPHLTQAPGLSDVQMDDSSVVYNPDGTLAIPPPRTPTPDAVNTTAMVHQLLVFAGLESQEVKKEGMFSGAGSKRELLPSSS
ncbi:hypothetical protein DXG01_001196 [Tephrocybe rancida]|nr:hypothetical protein DXG01_001196 [Tephrocybe rancida]